MLTLVLALVLHLIGLLPPSLRQKLACRATGGRLRWAKHRSYRRLPAPAVARHRQRAKLAWAARKIVRLKALLPRAGGRTIADCFNRRFATQ